MPPTTIPDAPAYRVVNARIPRDLACLTRDVVRGRDATSRPDDLATCEIVVAEGRIARLEVVPPSHAGAPAAGPDAARVGPGDSEVGGLPVVDLEGGIALPRFVDMHTHIDKGHIAGRSPNQDGTFEGARAAVMADRAARWSAEDVARRMSFSLRCADAHGTGALRTHLDSAAPQAAISWPVFAEMREHWRGRIALQAVALFPYVTAVEDPDGFDALVALVARHGGILGGLTHMGEAPDAKLDAALDRMIAAAAAHGLDLDLHVDESASPDARSLERIAEAALRHRFAGRITAGHCCSLALAAPADRDRVAAKVAEAGIAVVSLPMCNMYLQDREAGRTPRWRGVAPLHELDAAGVAVAVASDNTRDPFYAYGDLDMIEVFREATRILHLDHSASSWTRLLGPAPAEIMRLPEHGTIREGGPADLVLTRARTLAELVTRPQSDRIVLVAGRAIDTTPPDYRELD